MVCVEFYHAEHFQKYRYLFLAVSIGRLWGMDLKVTVSHLLIKCVHFYYIRTGQFKNHQGGRN